MYLKSLELSGFKSFAKKSHFEFNSPISSIVGPNGSGKSNVAEAFRFVLGEQSIKSMRGKKGEDLIWNGSPGEARANRGYVKVVFDNSKKIFDLDFSEVSIERTVHRDGLNEYFINGSAVRLKDVLELLSRAHIGASGHHIISQGEADKIITATPKERKGMIEEALGLKVYQYKRLESERKLLKTFENINQVESLRHEIAPHLKFLKKQVEKLEKTEGLRQELLDKAQIYFKYEDDYITKTRVELDNTRKPLLEKREKLAQELVSAKKILEESARQENKNYDILEVEKEISSLRSDKDNLSREIGKLEGLASAEERLIKRQKELSETTEHKMVKLSEIEDLAEEISKEKEGEGLLSRIKQILSNFIKSKYETLDSHTIEESEERLKVLMNDKKSKDEEYKKLEEREAVLKNKYEALNQELLQNKDSSHDAEKGVFRIMSEENEIVSSLNNLKLEEERLARNEEEFKQELEEVTRLVGVEVLRFKEKVFEMKESNDRKEQEDRKHDLLKLKIRLEDSNVAGSEEVYKEYKDTSERDEFLAKELLDLTQSAESLKTLIGDLEIRLATEFSSGLESINTEFNKLFTKMFGGGEASLVLTKDKKVKKPEEDEFELESLDEEGDEKVKEEGIDIKVSLPKKKIKSLLMLSGGERALTSIALVFAISQVNPPPFIILDETDAALDEANSKKYGDLVEALSEYSQLILITHNRETMSRAGVIYGVTMGSNGVSKLLSISFDEAVEVAK